MNWKLAEVLLYHQGWKKSTQSGRREEKWLEWGQGPWEGSQRKRGDYMGGHLAWRGRSMPHWLRTRSWETMSRRPATLAGWRTIETHRRAVGSLDSTLETEAVQRLVCSMTCWTLCDHLAVPWSQANAPAHPLPITVQPGSGRVVEGAWSGKRTQSPLGPGQTGEAAAAIGDEGEGGLCLRLRLSGVVVPTQAVLQNIRLWPAQAESPPSHTSSSMPALWGKGPGAGRGVNTALKGTEPAQTWSWNIPPLLKKKKEWNSFTCSNADGPRE